LIVVGMACPLKLSPVNVSSANLLMPGAFQTQSGLKHAFRLRLSRPILAGADKNL
jgi:hypothetical protein